MKIPILRWRRRRSLIEKEMQAKATLDIKNYYRSKQAENRRNLRLLKRRQE